MKSLYKSAIIRDNTRNICTLKFNKYLTEDEIKRIVKKLGYTLIKIIKIKELD